MADLSNQVCNICCIHYNAGLRCCALGSAVEGGYLFAKFGGQAWIVACSSSQVRRSWYCRADAVTVAEACVPCGDWFLPSKSDLMLGVDCKAFWDSYGVGAYWSNSGLTPSAYPSCAKGQWNVSITNHTPSSRAWNSSCLCVRAFRRVFY